MGAGSVTLGGTLMPYPSTFERERHSVGDGHNLADGSETWDHLAYKHRWDMAWTALTGAERGTVVAAFATSYTVQFNDWDGTLGTVIPARNALKERLAYGIKNGSGTTYYNLTWTLSEV